MRPLLLTALLLTGVGMGHPPTGGEVDRVLGESRQAESREQDLADQLARGGASALPELVDVLARGSFEAPAGDGGTARLPLLTIERAAVVAAVGKLPLRDVREYLEQIRKLGADEGQSLAALEILGAHGGAGDLLNVAEWSHPAGGEARVARTVPPAIAEAMAELLEREPSAWSSVTKFYRSVHLSAVRSVLSRLGELESEPALASLVDFIGGVPQADPLVLGEITHVAGVVAHPIDPRLRSRIRGRLSSSNDLVLSETIQALAAMEDNEAIPELIALLEHGSENICVRAHAALKALSGEPFSRDLARWKGWHREATNWWSQEGQRELQRASSGPAAQASRAIMVLSRQPLYRHEIAESLVQALERREPELVVMTCAALGRLGSSVAVDGLVEALDHDREDVRGAVHAALVQITGEDKGPSSRDWRRMPSAR